MPPYNELFYVELLKYSEDKGDKVEAAKEWTALSRDPGKCDLRGGLCKDMITNHQIDTSKLPNRKHHCICGHHIKINKFIYNVRNKNILTVGCCCIKRYITFQKKKKCHECQKIVSTKSKRVKVFCDECRLKWGEENGYRCNRLAMKISEGGDSTPAGPSSMTLTGTRLCGNCKKSFATRCKRDKVFCDECRLKWGKERGYRCKRLERRIGEGDSPKTVATKICRGCDKSVATRSRRFTFYCDECKSKCGIGKGRRYAYVRHMINRLVSGRFPKTSEPTGQSFMNATRPSQPLIQSPSCSYVPSNTTDGLMNSSTRLSQPLGQSPSCSYVLSNTTDGLMKSSTRLSQPLVQSPSSTYAVTKTTDSKQQITDQINGLQFSNKEILLGYIQRDEYLDGNITINFGKFSSWKMKDFSDQFVL